MNREIICKAKRVDNNKWVKGHYYRRYANIGGVSVLEHCIQVVDEKLPSATIYEVYPETVCRFTSLSDKNGKRIWEGDIIRWVDWKGNVRQSPVRWDTEWGRFCVWLDGAESLGVNKHLSNDIEVIGNVHDNPELIPK